MPRKTHKPRKPRKPRKYFTSAGQPVTVKRAKKSMAHKKFGRRKTIRRVKIEPEDFKVQCSFSLPVWQKMWIEEQAQIGGMHNSTFVAGIVSAAKQMLEDVERQREMGDPDEGILDEEENEYSGGGGRGGVGVDDAEMVDGIEAGID